MTYKPSKLAQTDLIFGLWLVFIIIIIIIIIIKAICNAQDPLKKATNAQMRIT